MTKHKDLFQVNILNTLVQLSGGNAACAAADPNAAGESVFLPAEQLSASGSASIIQMVCGGEKSRSLRCPARIPDRSSGEVFPDCRRTAAECGLKSPR
mgnify:CR=1 FL=1